MTREEEIQKAAKIFRVSSDDYTVYKKGFEAGAEWADQHPRKGLWDAEKVIGWLMNNINNYLVKGRDVDLIYEDLRKAMDD